MMSMPPMLCPSTPELAGASRMPRTPEESFRLKFESLLVRGPTKGSFVLMAAYLRFLVVVIFVMLGPLPSALSLPHPRSLDNTYTRFHSAADHPVAKYLQEPVYFEVELKGTKLADVSLELDSCWATLDSSRFSQPRWNLVING